MTVSPPNIPSPDPSDATNKRQEQSLVVVNEKIDRNREEMKGWVEALQVLLENSIASGNVLLSEKIKGSEDKTANLDRVVQTRLAGSETALNAAMAAADKVTQEIKLNIGAVLNELKAGMTKQIEALNEKVEDLKKRVFESGGKSEGISHMASTIISAIAALAAAISVVVVLSRSAPTAVVEPAQTYQKQRL